MARPSLAAAPGEQPPRALIFAGGGLRLSYQAGAALALEEAGLRFTHFEGTSGGGVNLAMLLSGLTPAEMCERWRTVPIFDFLSPMPLSRYVRHRSAVALGGSSAIRRRAFPHLGVNYARIRQAEVGDAWFNLYNFDLKSTEAVPHTEMDEDALVAGLSLPGLLPPVQRGEYLYLDAGFVRDADPIEAVRRGARELWILWALGDTPTYLGGPLHLYVQTLEASAVGTLHEDIRWLAEINERIEAGETVYGHREPIRLHFIRPERPLPLDPELYTGRIDHATLVAMGYADASRYLAEMQSEGVPLRPEVTRMKPHAVGLTFRETMAGPFTLGVTDPREGAAAAGNHRLAMHASVTIESMDEFVAHEERPGRLTGRVDFTPWGKGIPAVDGVFNLFAPSDDPDLKLMVYELALRHEGRPYYLAGRKEVRSDHHGLDLWSDTTTLYTTLHEGESKDGPVIGSGVLSLGPDDLARLLTTVRVTGSTSAADTTRTIAQFGQFFMGELWDTYGAPYFQKRPLWRKVTGAAGSLFGLARSAAGGVAGRLRR
jgi:hypothetical protein